MVSVSQACILKDASPGNPNAGLQHIAMRYTTILKNPKNQNHSQLQWNYHPK